MSYINDYTFIDSCKKGIISDISVINQVKVLFHKRMLYYKYNPSNILCQLGWIFILYIMNIDGKGLLQLYNIYIYIYIYMYLFLFIYILIMHLNIFIS